MGGAKKLKKHVKAWKLFLLLLPLLFVSATLLRLDHLRMNDLKNAVLEADAAEDDAKIEESLRALKDFTESHTIINIIEKNGAQRIAFGSGPFYLEHQYTRKAAEKLSEAQKKLASTGSTNPNGNIYQKAREVCEPQAQANGWAWNSTENISCWTSELAKYPTTDRLETEIIADIPSTNLYRYDFISPIWAPTIAGFVSAICAILIIIILGKIFMWIILRISLYFIEKTS